MEAGAPGPPRPADSTAAQPPGSRSGRRALHVGAFLACAGLAIYWTWPLAAHLTSRIPHDPGDPLLNTWILWWNASTVPLTGAWWNGPMLFPMPDALALSEHLLGISAFATPMQAAGATPLVAYNTAIIFSFALSAFSAWMLALRLTGSPAAAVCAGLAFGFAPYRAGHLSHLQVLTSQWMPLLFLGLHGYVADGRRRWLALAGASWLIQSLANGYYMLFLPALIVPWVLYFAGWRRAPGIGGALAIASIPLLPIVLTYHRVHAAFGFSRAPDDIRRFSATVDSFLQAPPLLAVWPAGGARTQEHFLFPGVTALLVVLAAIVVRARQTGAAPSIVRRRPAFAFYTAATLAMWLLALGPGPEGAFGLLHPYRWLWWLPGFDGLRVPARFAMLGAFCLSIAVALALQRLTLSSRIAHAVLVAAVAAGLAADGMLEPLPIVAPPARVLPSVSPDTVVLEIPPDDPRVSAAAMYRAMFHRLPLVNGYSGHTPAHYAILSEALRRSDTSPLLSLAAGRPLAIFVDARADPDGGFRALIAALPGIERHGDTAAGAMFVLPAQPASGKPPGTAAPPAGAAWIPPARVQIDLGAPRTITALDLVVRHRFREVDRRMLIEASDDGEGWKEVWVGWTGALVMEAALADPRSVPMRIPLPAVRARYLRVYPARDWMARDALVVSR